MKKWTEIIIHTLFWLCTAWLIASSFSIQSHEIEVVNDIEKVKIVRNNGLTYQLLICILFSLIAFYINSWLIVKSNRTGNINNLIWYALVTFVILIALVYAVTEIRFLSNMPPIPKQIAFGVSTFYFSLSIAYALIKNSIYNNQRNQQLIIDKKHAELSLLRNQLQPHFLFNALNNLLSMVKTSENPQLINAIDKLSHLLRFVIEDNRAEKIPISKEIEFLKNYIELQMLRFEEGEINVEFNVKGENTEQKIEPGLFIPFVENAFKYGTEPEKTSKIDIQFNLSKGDAIQFEIKNKTMMMNKNSIGTGIETTQKRLDLIYHDKHKLKISNGDEFIVQLIIFIQ
ncbi:sensor histidine kinase [Aquimarina pacifica]|uniref:sensor histidine kinase n=1 Tax=Aquimarina pacifica TaxID=1296415 RepID=UPI0004700D99|nr:sensor histidine kinase [Aquimarina pacifica]